MLPWTLMFRRTVISVLAAQKHIEVVDDDEAIDLSDNAIVFFFLTSPSAIDWELKRINLKSK